jgi:hypothetical protein
MNLDNVIEITIGEMFPGSTVPDSSNYLPNGNQYKAPDHSILGGVILIERKSRNAVDHSQYYNKFHEISKKQGSPMLGFGLFNLGSAIERLPDPDAASIEITDYFHSQIWKRIRETDKKFKAHREAVGGSDQTRILILSDESEIAGATSFTEHFLGRKMGGYGIDDTGLIDSIIYVKNPKFVLDGVNSYWFKVLIKKRVSDDHVTIIKQISSKLHTEIKLLPEYTYETQKFQKCSFRPLLV